MGTLPPPPHWGHELQLTENNAQHRTYELRTWYTGFRLEVKATEDYTSKRWHAVISLRPPGAVVVRWKASTRASRETCAEALDEAIDALSGELVRQVQQARATIRIKQRDIADIEQSQQEIPLFDSSQRARILNAALGLDTVEISDG